jgi:glycosyltransferase involved in cell wall biosynthesis
MPRVLHLVPGQPDFQTERSVASLLNATDSSSLVVDSLPRAVARLRGGFGSRPEVVHAWGMKSLAGAVVGARGPIVFSPTVFPTARAAGWLRAAMSYRDVQVVCSSATQRRFLVERGVPVARCHLIRPGVDFSRVRRRRDAELRRRLGFAEDDYVVLAVGESTRAAAHRDAVWAMSIANFVDPRFRLLLWGRGESAGAALSRAQSLAERRVVAGAEQLLRHPVDFESLLPAADAVLVTARGPVATLPIAVCMAAALPIVSTVTYTVSELLENNHTAVMVPRPAARLVARKLLDLRGDTQTQWSISDMARTEAYEYFSLTRFLDQFRTAYRQVAAGAKVEIPEPAPGAGRRFHQRA